MVPVIRLRGLKPPPVEDAMSELSRRMGDALSDALGDEPVAADDALECLAVWVAALIDVHPASRQYLANHFNMALAEMLRMRMQ